MAPERFRFKKHQRWIEMVPGKVFLTVSLKLCAPGFFCFGDTCRFSPEEMIQHKITNGDVTHQDTALIMDQTQKVHMQTSPYGDFLSHGATPQIIHVWDFP